MENTAKKKKNSDPKLKQDNMHISKAGITFIADFEGCRLTAYKCAAKRWTIGYGHTEGVKEGDTLPSEKAAKKLLKKDLKIYGNHVNECVRNGQISFPLNQNMFDALTSFTYNCGPDNLHTLVNGRSAATVADKMLLYNKANKKELPGLTERRKKERALFLG